MPVQIPPLDSPVAWAILAVGYLLYVIACSCASPEQNGSDSIEQRVWSDDVQSSSLADDNVEEEELLVGGEAASDENEGRGEACDRPALSPLFASGNDAAGTLCAPEPLRLEDDASIASFDPSSMSVEPPSVSSLYVHGSNQFAPLAVYDDSLQEDDSMEDISAEEACPLVSSMGVEEGGDEKKKKKLNGKGKSRGKSKGDRSINKGGALPSKRWGFAL